MKNHIFLCAVCDVYRVNSDIPNTGKFYNIHGETWTASGEWRGDYTSILVAICSQCLSEGKTLMDCATEMTKD